MTESNDKKPFSFGFTKKIEKQSKIEKSAIAEKHVEVNEETDFVLGLEGKEVKSSKPKEESKELVIPLIQKNVWQRDEIKNTKSTGNPNLGDDVKKKDRVEGARKEGKAMQSISDEAVQELLREAAEHNDEWQQRGETDLNMSIPLLMRNKVPEGYEEDERLDVSLRPQETSGEDYDEVPIEQFGMAMLRGMGFKEEEGIGDKMKKTVKPLEVTVRPKGQGLGADKRPVMPKKQVKRKPGDKKVDEEPVGIAKGVGVLVTTGPHKNLYGKIEGVDDDNARVVIKLAISNQTVTLSQYGVQLVDKEEYKKCAKDLGKFSRGHDELAKRQEKESSEERRRHKRKEENGHEDDRSSDHRRKRDRDDDDRKRRKRNSDYESDDRSDYERTSKRKHREDRERTSEKYRNDHERTSDKNRDGNQSDDHKRHKRDYDDRRDDGHRRKDDHDRKRKDKDRYSKDTERDRRRQRDESREDKDDRRQDRYDEKRQDEEDDQSNTKPSQYWLYPDLRVRFIDKNFKKGKYYNSKVAIIDVVTRETCTCRTEEGRLLEDIHQDMIETLIPKTDPGYVMIVNGELKGQLGTVLKRDKTNCKAAIQLLQHRDQIMKLDYNDICEYVGDIQANEDY